MYKRGVLHPTENIVADALSRLPEVELEGELTQLAELTNALCIDWVDFMIQENKSDPWICDVSAELESGDFESDYEVKGGILFYRNRLCLGLASELRTCVLEELHSSRGGGHTGYYRTLNHVHHTIFWKGMNKFMHEFVTRCLIYQQTKVSALKPMGLLQPLSIPVAVWEDLSMDFVTGLPPVKGHSVIIVVVDQLSKYYHLRSLPASSIAD